MDPFLVRHRIVVRAPVERCFALSTSVAIVQRELKMRPVAGRTSGFVVGGDTVRWQGWQLGFPNFHVSMIENFEAPHHFRDRMLAGRFRTFAHDHEFAETADGTELRDEVRFTMPFGIPGLLVGGAVLVPHIRTLLHRRFALIKRLAETDGWREYLPDERTAVRQ